MTSLIQWRNPINNTADNLGKPFRLKGYFFFLISREENEQYPFKLKTGIILIFRNGPKFETIDPGCLTSSGSTTPRRHRMLWFNLSCQHNHHQLPSDPIIQIQNRLFCQWQQHIHLEETSLLCFQYNDTNFMNWRGETPGTIFLIS